MTPEEEKAQQDLVVAAVNEIHAVLAGLRIAEAKTALTLSVVASIVATSGDDRNLRLMEARMFGKQVADYVNRQDIVEWMQAGIDWVRVTETRQ